MDLPSASNDWQAAFVARLVTSFDRATGGDLVAEAGLDAAALGRSAWEGNFALLSHSNDAILTHANRFALGLWEMDWQTMLATPSRETAPKGEDRETRAALMDQVARDGFIRNYAGRRVSRSGRLFRIENATVWTMTDEKARGSEPAHFLQRHTALNIRRMCLSSVSSDSGWEKDWMRTFSVTALTAACVVFVTGSAWAQGNSLAALTQRAVSACEIVVSTKATISAQAGLDGFVPITISGTDEAVGRGIMNGKDQAFVKIVRSKGVCVIMVRDTIRNDAGPAINHWSQVSGIALESRPDGSRWARRGSFDYRHSVTSDHTNILLVAFR